MKRIIPLTLLGFLLAACQTQNVSADNSDNVTEQQLIHHNFVLTEVDGHPIVGKVGVPSLSFGEKCLSLPLCAMIFMEWVGSIMQRLLLSIYPNRIRVR